MTATLSNYVVQRFKKNDNSSALWALLVQIKIPMPKCYTKMPFKLDIYYDDYCEWSI